MAPLPAAIAIAMHQSIISQLSLYHYNERAGEQEEQEHKNVATATTIMLSCE